MAEACCFCNGLWIAHRIATSVLETFRNGRAKMKERIADTGSNVSRRAALGTIGAVAGAAAFATEALAQPAQPAPNAARVNAPSVISNPPRDFGPNAPVTYPD